MSITFTLPVYPGLCFTNKKDLDDDSISLSMYDDIFVSDVIDNEILFKFMKNIETDSYFRYFYSLYRGRMVSFVRITGMNTIKVFFFEKDYLTKTFISQLIMIDSISYSVEGLETEDSKPVVINASTSVCRSERYCSMKDLYLVSRYEEIKDTGISDSVFYHRELLEGIIAKEKQIMQRYINNSLQITLTHFFTFTESLRGDIVCTVISKIETINGINFDDIGYRIKIELNQQTEDIEDIDDLSMTIATIMSNSNDIYFPVYIESNIYQNENQRTFAGYKCIYELFVHETPYDIVKVDKLNKAGLIKAVHIGKSIHHNHSDYFRISKISGRFISPVKYVASTTKQNLDKLIDLWHNNKKLKNLKMFPLYPGCKVSGISENFGKDCPDDAYFHFFFMRKNVEQFFKTRVLNKEG